jgi:hypothetical protein
MLHAYLDESGIHSGAAVCVIAGYFGGAGQWGKFEVDWRKMLANFNVPMGEFHSKDIFPKAKGFFHPKNWSGDIQAFRWAIAETIAAQTKIHPVSAAIIVDHFNSFSLDERRYMTGATFRLGKLVNSGCPGKPYFAPFLQILVKICEYAPVGGKAHFFFGLDRQFAGYAIEMFKQIEESDLQSPGNIGDFAWKQRLGRPATPLAKETPQLQIADVLANLTYNYMLDAGDKMGELEPSPLLAKCIQNRRSHEDFFFNHKGTMRAALDRAIQFGQILRELADLSPETSDAETDDTAQSC